MPELGVHDSNTPYNWHPAVHNEHFGETLYFIMLRLREPRHEPVADQVRNLMQAAGVEFACEYALFGWWDALVRVWLTPVAYKRLLQIFAPSAQNNIADFRGFATGQIRYLWTGTDQDLLCHDVATLAEIAANTEHIKRTVEDPNHSDQPVWTALKTAKLVFPRQPSSIDSVKFYTSLERTHDKMSVEEEIESILAAMDAAGMAPRASLYQGAGTLAAYLVRCVADTYKEVLDLAAIFDINLKDARLRPMTLLIANTDGRESDHVNEPTPLSLEENNDLDLLGHDDASHLARLSTAERLRLHGLIINACELPGNDTELRDKLLTVLRAVVTDSHSDVQGSLAFLLDFEFHLRERLVREWAAVFGNDWLNLLRVMCREHADWDRHTKEIESKVDRWSLGTLHFAACVSSDQSPQLLSRIRRHLGEDWKQEIPALRRLRNELAHGHLHKLNRPYEFDEKMVTFIERVMAAAVLWRKCMGSPEKT